MLHVMRLVTVVGLMSNSLCFDGWSNASSYPMSNATVFLKFLLVLLSKHHCSYQHYN